MMLFITKVAAPIVEAWDYPAVLFEKGESLVVNDAMLKLMSWTDVPDTEFKLELSGDRLNGTVYGSAELPRSFSYKCAGYSFPGTEWTLTVCDTNPDQLLKLLLAAFKAHVKAYHTGNAEFAAICDGFDVQFSWTAATSGQGHDVRVLSDWRSVRDIYEKHRDGWRCICKTPLRDLDMRVSGVVSISRRVEDFERGIITCIDERQTLENIASHSGTVFFRCASQDDYPVLYISDNITRYNVREDILSGKGVITDLYAAEQRNGLLFALDKNKGGEFTYEHKMTLNGGGECDAKTVIRFINDGEGMVIEGQITDVTVHKAALEELELIMRPVEERLGYDLQENVSPLGNEVSLYDVLDITDAQDMIARMFGVGSALIDMSGNSITGTITHNPAGELCDLINIACGNQACDECHRRIAEMVGASGHNEVMYCKATGFAATAAPVRIGERIVAAWMLCQMLPEDAEMLTKGDVFGADTEILRGIISNSPRFGISSLENVRSMLDLAAEQVSMLATRNAGVFVQQDVNGLEQKHKKRLTDNLSLLFNCFEMLKRPEQGSAFSLLEVIARSLRFGRAYFYKADRYYTLCYEWYAHARLPREVRMPPRSIFPDYKSQTLEIYEPARIPESAVKRYAELSGARSIVHLPVFIDGNLYGIIGLDECLSVRIFFEGDKSLLSSLLGLVASAIVREYTEHETSNAARCLEEINGILANM